MPGESTGRLIGSATTGVTAGSSRIGPITEIGQVGDKESHRLDANDC